MARLKKIQVETATYPCGFSEKRAPSRHPTSPLIAHSLCLSGAHKRAGSPRPTDNTKIFRLQIRTPWDAGVANRQNNIVDPSRSRRATSTPDSVTTPARGHPTYPRAHRFESVLANSARLSFIFFSWLLLPEHRQDGCRSRRLPPPLQAPRALGRGLQRQRRSSHSHNPAAGTSSPEPPSSAGVHCARQSCLGRSWSSSPRGPTFSSPRCRLSSSAPASSLPQQRQHSFSLTPVSPNRPYCQYWTMRSAETTATRRRRA